MIVEQPRVLLVDDRPENLLALAAVLEPLPCELVSVASGAAALKALLNDEFAVVLLDVQMPGMDGFETAELIKSRERTRALPIIFVTAINKQSHHVFRGYTAGAVDYVFKPYDPGILRAKVAVFLELDAVARTAARNEAVMRAVVDHAPIGMARLDLDGRIADANPAFAALLGYGPADLHNRCLDDLVHPEDAGADAERRRRVLHGGLRTYTQELRLVARDGAAVPCALSLSAAHDAEGAPEMLVVQVSDLRDRLRMQAEQERAVREQAARERAEHVSRRLQAVQQITDVALSSLGFEQLVGELLHRTADVLGVDTGAIVLGGEGDADATVYQVAGAVDAPVQTRRWPLPAQGMSAQVMREGRPTVVEDVAAGGTEAAHPLGDSVTSVLGVPLVVEGRAIGALHIGTLFSRRFTEDDVSLLGLAADRAALAIERARLFDREHRIAQELQRSLLPDALAELPGVRTAARYQPAGAGSQVGGDWYDVLHQPGGKLLLIIGDVAGRGIEAAATMGQLRSALRAYAFDGHGPAALLERLNAFHNGLANRGMATVGLVSVDPSAGELCYAQAGHPPALLLGPDHSVRWLDEAEGIPLGVLDDPAYTQVSTPIEPGSVLVLYTDGLIEIRGEHLDQGFRRLEKAVLGAPTDLEDLCASVIEHALADPEVDDDVTLLVLGTVSSHDPRIVLSVAGSSPALHAFRVTVRRWLSAASGDATEVDEITMAVNEAVQNAIEHGHGRRATPVSVVLERIGDQLQITVMDKGRWTEGATTDRGRGLALMRAHMDEVVVLPTKVGTSLVLRRALRHPSSAGERAVAPRRRAAVRPSSSRR